jgi:hypothetical protein
MGNPVFDPSKHTKEAKSLPNPLIGKYMVLGWEPFKDGSFKTGCKLNLALMQYSSDGVNWEQKTKVSKVEGNNIMPYIVTFPDGIKNVRENLLRGLKFDFKYAEDGPDGNPQWMVLEVADLRKEVFVDEAEEDGQDVNSWNELELEEKYESWLEQAFQWMFKIDLKIPVDQPLLPGTIVPLYRIYTPLTQAQKDQGKKYGSVKLTRFPPKDHEVFKDRLTGHKVMPDAERVAAAVIDAIGKETGDANNSDLPF